MGRTSGETSAAASDLTISEVKSGDLQISTSDDEAPKCRTKIGAALQDGFVASMV
jgi:hypothetical protein